MLLSLQHQTNKQIKNKAMITKKCPCCGKTVKNLNSADKVFVDANGNIYNAQAEGLGFIPRNAPQGVKTTLAVMGRTCYMKKFYPNL